MDAEKAKKIWKYISEDPNIAPCSQGCRLLHRQHDKSYRGSTRRLWKDQALPMCFFMDLQSPEVREVMKESLPREKLDALGDTVVDVTKRICRSTEEVEEQVERAKDAVEAGMDGNYGPLRDVAGDVKKKIGEIPRTPMEMLIWWDKAPIEDKVKIIHSAGTVLGKVTTKKQRSKCLLSPSMTSSPS